MNLQTLLLHRCVELDNGVTLDLPIELIRERLLCAGRSVYEIDCAFASAIARGDIKLWRGSKLGRFG